MAIAPTQSGLVECYHCGDACRIDVVRADDKNFCCDGCKAVYELLKESDLCGYYDIDRSKKLSPKTINYQGKFDFLDDEDVIRKLILFTDGTESRVVFHLPQMHCSSCVWLLEHLYRIDKGIFNSKIDFLRKEITIQYATAEVSLKRIVELLSTLGYEPLLRLNNLEKKVVRNPQRKRLYRMAVAGFGFANIMMLSFPEYFHIDHSGDTHIQSVFSWLNFALAIPVLLFSGGEFFQNAFNGLKGKVFNIDFTLSLSIGLTFCRSAYEIFTGTGAGYLDSMSGIIFFMLVGRYFQDRTHYALQFDRNYKSFFPISVVVIKQDGSYGSVPLTKLKTGDRISVKSGELIPADCICMSDHALIDYSFVTGESKPVRVRRKEIIYAGGKQTGTTIECEIIREVSQSYLTDLWNKDAFKTQSEDQNSFVQRLARHFTLFLLILSTGAFFYWMRSDMGRALNAVTTVLIVACPCALLLSATFTNGAMMRLYGKLGVYLKNPQILEGLAKTKEIVLDKTGTITSHVESVKFEGKELNEQYLCWVNSLATHSNHPLSRSLAEKFAFCDMISVTQFQESPGQGISGSIDGKLIKLGSASFVGFTSTDQEQEGLQVYLSIDGQVWGRFVFTKRYRPHLNEVVHELKKLYKVTVLSGDNDHERKTLSSRFGDEVALIFNQSPQDKLDHIAQIEESGKEVLMIGDGLNDAGALQRATTGIAISDDVNNFSPACDAIMKGDLFEKLPAIIHLSRKTQWIIKGSFVISLLYNVIGLSFAVQGILSPVVAAILMPLSSISIVLFTTGSSWLAAKSVH